jgi:hypothetical protein
MNLLLVASPFSLFCIFLLFCTPIHRFPVTSWHRPLLAHQILRARLSPVWILLALLFLLLLLLRGRRRCRTSIVHTMEPGSQHRFFNAGRENATIAAPAHTSNHGQRVAPGSEQGDPGGSAGGAAFVAGGGDACQAGEPRARAAALRRQAARPHTPAAGQAEAIATLSPST